MSTPSKADAPPVDLARWRKTLAPWLTQYISIPAKSPNFDPDWERHGHLGDAAELLLRWARARAPSDATVELLSPPGRTPLLLVDAPGEPGPATLVYGHLDKQPEMDGWRDSGPWEPRLSGDRLYGRGGADDGYALFAALEALATQAAAGMRRRRCVVLIEASEESGSPDLAAYLDELAPRLGAVDFVICLDSGCGDYDRLWYTVSLRGLVSGLLRARVLEEAVHSGDATGVVPSSLRVLRQVLDRLEDPGDGRIRLPGCDVPAPPEFEDAIAEAANLLSVRMAARHPRAGSTRPARDDELGLLRARGWEAGLEVTAATGLPQPAGAGNVLRPETGLALSLRLPPTVDAEAIATELEAVLLTDPPEGAEVGFERGWVADGWYRPAAPAWLLTACDAASHACFGKSAGAWAEGVTVPFLRMLERRYPDAAFLVTGVLGPGSNAHGPNEFLDLPTAARLAAALPGILEAHCLQGAATDRPPD